MVRGSESWEFVSSVRDLWRFRLPDSTLPELASAVFVDAAMIVTVVIVIGDDRLVLVMMMV
jgi:hypothetical protein